MTLSNCLEQLFHCSTITPAWLSQITQDSVKKRLRRLIKATKSVSLVYRRKCLRWCFLFSSPCGPSHSGNVPILIPMQDIFNYLISYTTRGLIHFTLCLNLHSFYNKLVTYLHTYPLMHVMSSHTYVAAHNLMVFYILKTTCEIQIRSDLNQRAFSTQWKLPV